MMFNDITIVPVRTDRKAAYLAFSARIAEIYREYGAVRVVDCWQSKDANDADFHASDAMENYAAGELPDMRKLAGADEGETSRDLDYRVAEQRDPRPSGKGCSGRSAYSSDDG